MPDWQATEAYRIAVLDGAKEVDVTARDAHGLFDGVQTLVQLAHRSADGIWRIPPVKIDDYPRFQWRGYMVDSARHFRTKAEMLRIVELMALHKLNVLHLHLVDDQGWRIEIKRYPKLTTVGSEMPDYTGATGPGRFYTQDDVRELVAYAATRFVQVVPEIEMPGHSRAATTAYPELSCDGKPSISLCVTKESTWKFVTAVLDEVVPLFPSSFVHVGGDEVKADIWRACPTCSARMDRLAAAKPDPNVQRTRVVGAKNVGRAYDEGTALLEGDFLRRVDRYLAAKGKRIIGWDEILDGGLDKRSSAAVTAWRGPGAIEAAIREKRDVVAALYPECYLNGNLSLPLTYAFEPVPAGASPEEQSHVLGIQGNMWGEASVTEDDVDLATWPRLCAIAEIAWTPRALRDYDDFLSRLGTHALRLRAWGIVFGIPMGEQAPTW
jgi:hexosaminidase